MKKKDCDSEAKIFISIDAKLTYFFFSFNYLLLR